MPILGYNMHVPRSIGAYIQTIRRKRAATSKNVSTWHEFCATGRMLNGSAPNGDKVGPMFIFIWMRAFSSPYGEAAHEEKYKRYYKTDGQTIW